MNKHYKIKSVKTLEKIILSSIIGLDALSSDNNDVALSFKDLFPIISE